MDYVDVTARPAGSRQRAIIVGASGLVGHALLEAWGEGAVGTYRTRPRRGLVPLDASDPGAVRALVERVDPTVVFFPAGEPNVEWCERHPEEARELNLAPLLATLVAARGRLVVGYSTDYVFDGAAGPYDEDAPRGPLSVYGRIKAELEDRLIEAGGVVIRTTTVFGPEPEPPRNFVLRLVESLRRAESVRVPLDQISTPTYAPDLAAAAVRIAGAGDGIWHVAGSDLISRAALATLAAEVFGLPAALIRAVSTRDLGQSATRPLRGGLRCDRYERWFGAAPVRGTREALEDLAQRISPSTSS